jgi:hypothetical protein
MTLIEFLGTGGAAGALGAAAKAGVDFLRGRRASVAKVAVAEMTHAEQVMGLLLKRIDALEAAQAVERKECGARISELERRVDVAEERAAKAEGRAEALAHELDSLRRALS